MKKIGSRIVVLTMFGALYYSADKTLASVEATIDATVTQNLLVARKHIDASGLSTGTLIANTGLTLGQAMQSGSLSLSRNLSGADTGSLQHY